MKAKNATYFKSYSVQSGLRPLYNNGIIEIDGETVLVAITLFGDEYYFDPEEEVLPIDDDMMQEAIRITKESLLEITQKTK